MYKSPGRRAQSAIELVILIGFVLFFVTVFLLGLQVNIGDKTNNNKDLVLYDVAATVQDEVNLALASTDGYYREFRLRESILGDEYEVSIVDSFVYVRTVDERHATSLPIADVVGTTVNAGANVIRKENGVIYLNESPP